MQVEMEMEMANQTGMNELRGSTGHQGLPGKFAFRSGRVPVRAEMSVRPLLGKIYRGGCMLI